MHLISGMRAMTEAKRAAGNPEAEIESEEE